MLLKLRTIIQEGKNYIIDLDVNEYGVPELTVDETTDLGYVKVRSPLGKISIHNTTNNDYIYRHFKEGLIKATKSNREDFETVMNTALKQEINWEEVYTRANYYAIEMQRKYIYSMGVLANAIAFGKDTEFIKKIQNIKFTVKRKLYAYYKSDSMLIFVYKPERTVYIFIKNKKDESMQTELFNALIAKHKDKVWCTCENQRSTRYVTHYMGESHGHICNNCLRYVTIG